MIIKFKKHGKRRSQAGFTLIELLVVVGILVMISGIILTNQAKFGGQMLLRNLAYDVALSIREAQVYGISARSFLGAEFASGYGAYFNLTDGDNFFFLYTDIDSSNFFTPGGENPEWVETYSIGRGYTMDRICVPTGPTTESCNVTELDILFQRPEPDAIIRASINGSGFTVYDRATVVFESPQGKKLSVLVETTGQISVQRYAE